MTQRFNYMDFFSPHNRLKTRFSALAEAILSQVNDLFSLLASLPSAWSLDEAIGVQLDAVGALAGIPRPPDTSDMDYRLLLRARIAAHQWDGTNETLPGILAQAFPDRSAVLVDHQDGTVSAFLSGTASTFSMKELFPVTAGVRLTEGS